MVSFSDLGISESLIGDLRKNGITTPTAVQERVIPLVLKGFDVLVQSETGSGKTIGFALPTIESVKPTKFPQVLVLAPTRELAKQIGDEYFKFTRAKGLRTAVVYGGVSLDAQAVKVKQAEIIIGTPGRVLDLLNRNALNLGSARFLVLDEADRMLDMGFIDDINKIIKFMRSRQQTLLFSATINDRVMGLKDRYLHDAKDVILTNVLSRGVLKQYYYSVPENRKLSLLIHLLKSEPEVRALVFCNTKHVTRFVTEALKLNHMRAQCINGDMSQPARERALKDFIYGAVNILVATDVAARGIHVDDITHVINYDLHDDMETYTHRIGRTARNGRTGTAIILLSDRDYPKMNKLVTKYGGELEEREVGFLKPVRVPAKESRERRGGSRFPMRHHAEHGDRDRNRRRRY